VKQALKQLLGRFNYHVEGTRYTPRHLFRPECVRTLQFHDVICRYMFEHGQICTFIQVGAYDGVSTDPLRRYIQRSGWRGVMVEPQPVPAVELRELYKGNANIIVVEAAVEGERMARTLYTVDSDNLPKWAGGMASFDRGHILKQGYLFPGIEKYIRELRVDCLPFAEIIESLPSRARLDLLQIDAEGADGRSIMVSFDRLKPAIVHWEIKNMRRAGGSVGSALLSRLPHLALGPRGHG
jgi:FkbM family methyltransferase